MKKSEQTRQQILNGAITLFKNNGVQNTSVNEIVKQLGIAKGTFFYYFPKKDDIIIEIINIEFSNYFSSPRKITENLEIDAAEKLQQVLLSLFKGINNNSTLQQIFRFGIDPQFLNYINQLRLKNIIPLVVDIIEQGVKQKVFDIKNIDITSSIITHGIASYINSNFKQLANKSDLQKFLNGVEGLLNKVLQSKTIIKLNIK